MFFKLLITSLFALMPPSLPKSPHPPSGDRGRKPNVILIYADDLGFAETEPYGQQKIRTPNIARLSAEGMRFTDHYSGSPVCAPARCMLLTGKHAGHAHIRDNHGLGGFADSDEAGQMPLPEGTFTIGHLFRRAGYRTAAIGKWGLGMHDNSGSPNWQGFDYFFGYLDQKQAHNHYPTHLWENGKRVALANPEKFVHRPLDPETVREEDFDLFKGSDYAPERMTEKALRFMEEHREAPFFLYLPYTLPHVSLQVPDEYLAEYRDAFADTPYYGQDGYAAHRHPRAAYAAMVSFLDRQVGRILQQIKDLGLDGNTIVLFSSDNGTTFNGGVDHPFFDSTGGLRGLKADLFEGGIRVPFIARWPGKIPPGSVSGHLSAQYDLMATMAQLLGTTVPDTDGISFLPTLLQRGAQREHRFLYFEFPGKGGQLALRLGRWKGVKQGLKKRPDAPWMLFDLAQDPGERQDIAADHPEILRRLDGIVEEEHRPANIPE